MNSFRQFVTEGIREFPIEETPENRSRRLKAGTTELISVDANKVKEAFEQSHGESLVHKQLRLDKIEELLGKNASFDQYPTVGIYHYDGAPPIEIDDGRHRIAAAAKRGLKIMVATTKDAKSAIEKFK